MIVSVCVVSGDSLGVVCGCRSYWLFVFFFFNDTATTEIYTLSLHDALPISLKVVRSIVRSCMGHAVVSVSGPAPILMWIPSLKIGRAHV